MTVLLHCKALYKHVVRTYVGIVPFALFHDWEREYGGPWGGGGGGVQPRPQARRE